MFCLMHFRRYEEDMYWRRMEEEQHHWDDRRRIPDGGYPHGPPGPLGLLGVRPGMPPQPQGPAVSFLRGGKMKSYLPGGTVKNCKLRGAALSPVFLSEVFV